MSDFTIAPDADLVEEVVGAAIDFAGAEFQPSFVSVAEGAFREVVKAAIAEAARREREACAERLMDECRSLNERARELAKQGRYGLADDREQQADACARLAGILRARNEVSQ